MLRSEWMVLEEASSFDTNLDTPVESCSSLSPQMSFPMYLIHRGHLLTFPCWDAWSQLLRLAFLAQVFWVQPLLMSMLTVVVLADAFLLSDQSSQP